MNNDRKRSAFWLRCRPTEEFDIVKLHPRTLAKTSRFETVEDAKNENAIRIGMHARSSLSTTLAECLSGHYDCEFPSCAICARRFRRWFIGQALQLNSALRGPSFVITVLLDQLSNNEVPSLDPQSCSGAIRKLIQRNGLDGAVVIGGFELAYRAESGSWVFHCHLAVFGAKPAQVRRFQRATKAASELDRVAKMTDLRDPTKQLSYILKFTTYHRPTDRRGTQRAPAVRLNPREHLVLLEWFHQHKFSDFVFLFNARRRGAAVEPNYIRLSRPNFGSKE